MEELVDSTAKVDLPQIRPWVPPFFIGPAGLGMVGAVALLAITSTPARMRIFNLAPSLALVVIVHLMTFYFLGLAAKMDIRRVSIFFGGAILRFRKGETWFAVNWLPLGGCVMFQGTRETVSEGKTAWQELPRGIRAAMLVAGPVAVLALGLCIVGPERFVSILFQIPQYAREIFNRGPIRGSLNFIDHVTFRDLVGVVAWLFGVLNLLPLPMVNGGQALLELTRGDPK